MLINMKLIHKNLRTGEIKVKTECLDDLWYLSNIIEPGDIIKGETERKIKLGGEDERSQKIIKKTIYLTIEAEKLEFAKTSSALRISGIITEGQDDIPKGQYHTIALDENSTVTIIKNEWLTYQLDKLEEAQKPLSQKIMIVVFDREESHFALLNRQGYTLLASIQGDVAKKSYDEQGQKKNFFEQIINNCKEYSDRYNLGTIIFSSPSFWKDELQKELKGIVLGPKIIFATCSSADKSAISEVMRRQETQAALKEDRTSKEILLVEKLMEEISKNGACAYGIKETKKAVESGAVDDFMITDNLIKKSREDDSFVIIDDIMKKTEKFKGKITIISSDNDAGRRLDGIGGIGATLRYKMEY